MARKRLTKQERDERKEAKDLAKSVYYDHPEMHTGHASKEQKVTAAVAYLMGHSFPTAARIAGVSKPTIYDWKYRSSWWNELLNHLKMHHDADMEARTSGIISKALEAVEDRIDNGDEVLTKDGEVKRKAVGGRDMAIIVGTLYDKRQLMRNQPTNISASSTDQDRLERLKEQYEQLAEKKVNSLEGEYTEVTHDHAEQEQQEEDSG